MSSIEDRTAVREAALTEAAAGQRRLARPEDYVWDKSQEAFWDLCDGTLHGEKAVDGSIPQELWRVIIVEPPPQEAGARGRPARPRERLVKPSVDIMRIENDSTVEGSTWWPGRDQIIKDWFIDKNGFFPAVGRRSYNQYKAPPVSTGDAAAATPWIDHVKKLWPDPKEHEFFFDYCAHMVQFPEVKCNAAIVLSGTQGIGKDAALYPIRAAVGSWNVKGIDPDHLFSAFNPWVQTLMLVVDEVRPTKDEFHASAMYNILKPLIAAPPDTLPLNDKHTKLRHVINVMRVFITTNDWMAMYIPPEDRRMFVMHSTLAQKWNEAEGKPDYFLHLFNWMEGGGLDNVGAWLAARDLTEFKPKQQVEKTAGWDAVASTWSEPEDAVSLALEQLKAPAVVFTTELVRLQFDGVDDLAAMVKSPRKMGHRMQRSGYIAMKPPNGELRWVFKGAGDTLLTSRWVYVRQEIMNSGADVLELIKDHGKRVVASWSRPQLVGGKEGF